MITSNDPARAMLDEQRDATVLAVGEVMTLAQITTYALQHA
jgi:CBS domain-containing protein